MPSEHHQAFHAYSRFLAFGIALLMIIGGLLIWMWNGPGSALASNTPSFTLERQEDGSWPETPTGAADLTRTMDVSERKSTSTSQPIGYTSSHESARLAARSIAVINMSSEPIADLIARGVIAGLKDDPELQRIVYTSRNRLNPPGEIAPDIILTIVTDEYDENTIAGSGTMNSQASVTMSDQVARGLSITVTPEQAPFRVQFLTRFRSKNSIEQKGLASPNARIKAAAASQSNYIVERIRDSLSTLRAQHGRFPELPATFYPSYVAVDESQFDIGMVFADNESFDQLASWSDRLIHNRTWWHGHVAGSARSAVARIGRRLQKAGFERSNPTDKKDHTYRSGAIEVELIPTQTGQTEVDSSDELPAVQPMTELHVSYTHRADDGIRLAALDSVITNNRNTDLLMMCSPGWNKDQRLRGSALIETIDLKDPSHLMMRARMRHQAKNVRGTIDDLARAVIYGKAKFDHYDVLKDARKQAEKWGVVFEDKLSDLDWLRSAGATELTIGAEPVEFEITPGKPFFGITFLEGQLTTVAVGLKANDQGLWRGAIRVTGDSDSIQSGMISGRSKHTLDQFTVITEFLDDTSNGQSRVTLQLR
jgi:hypothetical protein